METHDGPLIDLAGAVLDGNPVDWIAAESSVGEAQAGFIRQMKIVAEVAELHRRTVPGGSLLEVTGAQPLEGTPESPAHWGHLKILERIGRGAFGEVYRAWNTRLDREVALKLLYPSSSAQESLESSVIHEGRLLARVRHPNVVTIYDADRVDGRVGLWMEFLHGRTLEQVLQEGRVFEPKEVIDVGVELCRALSAVHDVGMLHRDVKAQNVMRAEDGRLVLMDFGTGRELAAPGGENRDVAGTPLYLAPEIYAGREASVQSDLYSAGVLLYHLATGSYPVLGRTVREVREAHVKGLKVELSNACPDFPRDLLEVIDRALETRPESRFATAAEMADALDGLKSETVQPTKFFRARSYWMAGGVVLLLAILLVPAGLRIFNNWRDPEGTKKNAFLIPDPGAVRSRKIDLPNNMLQGAPSPDGRYFPYAEWTAGNLVLLDLAGGERRFLTHQTDRKKGYAMESVFSPNSSQIAYCYYSEECACWQLRIVGIEGGNSRIVYTDTGIGEFWPYQWSSDGREIVGRFAAKDTVYRLGFVSVADGSVRIVKELPKSFQSRPNPFISLSPDGRFIAYDLPDPESPEERDIHLLASDGSRELPFLAGPSDDSHPMWTPDGTSLLFASDRTGTLSVWIQALVNGQPVGSPTIVKKDMGRFFPVGLTRTGAYFYELQTGVIDVYVAELDPESGTVIGEAVNPAATYQGSNHSPDWSPDGKSLCYVSMRQSMGPQARSLVIQDLEAGSRREFILGLYPTPGLRWLPDGRQICFRGTDSRGNPGLQIVEVQSGAIVKTLLRNRIGGSIVWTRDGTRAYFMRIRSGIFELDPVSERERLLFALPAGAGLGTDGLRLSPDGRWIAFSLQGGGSSLCLLPTAGGAVRELFRSETVVQVAGWLPQGNALLFTRSAAEEKMGLWLLPLNGGPPRELGLAMGGLREASVHPEGRRIAFTTGHMGSELWVTENFLPRK